MGLLVATPSAVYAADEWYTSSTDPSSKGYGYVGVTWSSAGNVTQSLDMWRTNNYVSLKSWINDEKEDGYCAGQEIAYQVYVNGAWSGYHHRMVPNFDCSHNGDGNIGAFYYSKYKTRNVHARACHVNSSGAKIHCESNWHGPI
ncbi:hypothetical protein [Streptomyces pini]|nr:hypothetical protein [Streptomyces pini]